MLSTVISRIGCAVSLIVACGAASADKTPSALRDPILGLRYDPSRVPFEALPRDAIANCETLHDTQNSRAVWYVYGRADDSSGRRYYIIGGYEVRSSGPAHLRYDTDGLGVALFTDRGECTYIDSARQVFDDRLFNDELPQQVLKQLALDVARRLTKAFGGAQRLRAEMQNQHVDVAELPPELRKALQSQLGGERTRQAPR